ncbi:hypothetical protein EDD85DRAFT_851749 [Armillaria nabsnona]|nr:hypothetical protein EDD85DRAFT_851749 [Armillaria nabsnona]
MMMVLLLWLQTPPRARFWLHVCSFAMLRYIPFGCKCMNLIDSKRAAIFCISRSGSLVLERVFPKSSCHSRFELGSI